MLITSKDGQTATGDWANFDVKANTALLGGEVIVSRGKDVAEGPRLKIDLTTGMYRFELEPEAAPPRPRPSRQRVATAPAAPSSHAETPTRAHCPPGKQCLLFYPKEAKDKAKRRGSRRCLPDAARGARATDAAGADRRTSAQPGACGATDAHEAVPVPSPKRRNATRRMAAARGNGAREREFDEPSEPYGGAGLAHAPSTCRRAIAAAWS